MKQALMKEFLTVGSSCPPLKVKYRPWYQSQPVLRRGLVPLIERGCLNRCKIAGFSCKILAYGYAPQSPLAYFRAPASRVAIGVSAGGSYSSPAFWVSSSVVSWDQSSSTVGDSQPSMGLRGQKAERLKPWL